MRLVVWFSEERRMNGCGSCRLLRGFLFGSCVLGYFRHGRFLEANTMHEMFVCLIDVMMPKLAV